MEKQGFLMWLLTAVIPKLFLWLCRPKMGLSPLAAQQFLENIGAGGIAVMETRNERCNGKQIQLTHDKLEA